MTEHYSKFTVSASEFCKKCNKYTTHRVDGGRKGPCLECVEKLTTLSAQREIDERRAGRQENLFRGVM